MKTIPRFPHAKLVAVLAAGVLAGGCGETGLDDLRQYVTEVNQRKAPSPEPLPPIKPYNVYTYGGHERDPFEPFHRQQQAEAEAQGGDSGVAPDFNRNREELEAYPLDSLRMVGTLERDQDVWALVLASDDTIHRVQVGNYLGQNHGKVVGIQEDRVELLEVARDAQGRWQERPASIALVQQE